MPDLLHVIAQAAQPPGGDSQLFGIGYILAAIATPLALIAVALISRRKRSGEQPDELAEDRKRHVRYLQRRVRELEHRVVVIENQLRAERADAEQERSRLAAESNLRLMHIGELETLLAQARHELALVRAQLEERPPPP